MPKRRNCNFLYSMGPILNFWQLTRANCMLSVPPSFRICLQIYWHRFHSKSKCMSQFVILWCYLPNLIAIQNFEMMHLERSNVTIVSPNRYWTHLGCWNVTVVSQNAQSSWAINSCHSRSKWILDTSRMLKRYCGMSQCTLDAKCISSAQTLV